jgi:hypothetical protein
MPASRDAHSKLFVGAAHCLSPTGGKNRRVAFDFRTSQCPNRTQSVNSAQVAEARKPASAIAWRSDSIQWGSNARRRASAHPRHANRSTAAATAITIAPVESVVEWCVGRVCVLSAGLKGVAVAGGVAADPAEVVLGRGVPPEGT